MRSYECGMIFDQKRFTVLFSMQRAIYYWFCCCILCVCESFARVHSAGQQWQHSGEIFGQAAAALLQSYNIVFAQYVGVITLL